jgi:small GTP-binding protein
MIDSSLINTLLENFLENVQELTAVLVVDADGLVVAQKSTKEFDEDIIAAIMAILDQTINKVKKYAKTSFGSGTLDTNEFRLFYLELGGEFPVIFVVVTDPYIDIDKYIPYSYLVAEKVSLLINKREINTSLPKLLENDQLKFNSHNNPNESSKNYILIVGSEQVGKTALVNKYARNTFPDKYKPTIGLSIIEKELQVSQTVQSVLYLFDMGGLKAFAKIRKHFYQSIDVKTVVIMFDYSREETLEDVDQWFYEVDLFNSKDKVEFVLVGNKIDKVKDKDSLKEKAVKIATQNNCPLYETSARTGRGIDELFMNIAF